MRHKNLPPDVPLGPQLRAFDDAFSAFTVIKKVWFPHLLTEREQRQIGPDRTAAALARAA